MKKKKKEEVSFVYCKFVPIECMLCKLTIITKKQVLFSMVKNGNKRQGNLQND